MEDDQRDWLQRLLEVTEQAIADLEDGEPNSELLDGLHDFRNRLRRLLRDGSP